MTQQLLVIGSTGKTGSRIARRLTEAGHAVRGVSRGTDPRFDWEDSSTWPAALAGVSAAYISFVPDLAVPGAARVIEALTQAAAEAGVRRLVLLSGRGESGAVRCEDIVRGCGLESTVLRSSWFSQNFSEGLLRDAVLGGVLALPAGEVAEPFVDVDDLAEVAVAALTEEGHAGRLYELTGPRLLTFADAAAELAAATGRDVSYLPVSAQDFREALAPVLGPAEADMLADLCTEVFDGRNAVLTDGVQQALGRPPVDFAQFCATAATAGAWDR